ncbi:MAG TPA: hypothetical protein VGE85_11415 [Terracidiphilus sp.]
MTVGTLIQYYGPHGWVTATVVSIPSSRAGGTAVYVTVKTVSGKHVRIPVSNMREVRA